MATPKRERQSQFHKAALEAYQRHGFRSYRHAEQVTGVNYSTIYTIVSRGRIPIRGQVIEWAEGLGESINDWLELAGYDPLPVGLTEQPEDPVERIGIALRENRKLSDQTKNRILDIVRDIIAEEEAGTL